MVRKLNGHKRSKSKVGATHKRKTHRSRRRRVSGVNDMSGMMQKAGGLVVGSVAARELNALAVKFFPTLSPIMSGLLQMGAGFVLPKFIKGAFFQNVADGMIANGGMVTIVSTGIISGTSDTMTYRINGTSNLKVIGRGTSNMPVINGPTTRISNNPTNSNVPRVMTRNIAVRG